MKSLGVFDDFFILCLPPWGGSGLKYPVCYIVNLFTASPSLGREWIEITSPCYYYTPYPRLPPWGGSGLKYRRVTSAAHIARSPSLGREWIEIFHTSMPRTTGMSPSLGREWIEITKAACRAYTHRSPSLGREWIEISEAADEITLTIVSLLGEGVD